MHVKKTRKFGFVNTLCCIAKFNGGSSYSPVGFVGNFEEIFSQSIIHETEMVDRLLEYKLHVGVIKLKPEVEVDYIHNMT